MFLLLGAIPASPVSAQTTATVYATVQRLERGMMIWRSDTGHIWVLGGNGQVLNFPASRYSRLRDNPIPANPPGRIRPIFGLGKVWGNFAEVRNLLGWPTLPEIGANMPIRVVNRAYYLTQLDRTVIVINPNNTWVRLLGGPQPANARIVSFNVTPNPVVPGQMLTFSWQVDGAELVLIQVFDDFDNKILADLTNLPTTGSTTFAVPGGNTENLRVVLWGARRVHVSGQIVEYARLVRSEVLVGQNLTIPTSTTTLGVFQQYQRGFMIWRADTGMVMAFFDTTHKSAFIRQSGYQGFPDNPFSDVPSGLVKPVNGFGRVWGNIQYIRDQLGWATGPEQQYQLTARILGTGPISFTLPDGRVVTVTALNQWSL
jgi:hypothetical protein